MPVDPSIILGIKQPNIQSPIDAASKAATLSSLTQQSQLRNLQLQGEQRNFNDQTALRQAYANNTQMGPDGNPTINRQGVLSDLNNYNPMLAQKQSLDFKQMDLDNLTRQHQIAKQILFNITPGDQNSLDQANAQAAQFGLPPLDNVLPPNASDPSFASALKTAQTMSLSAEQQLEQQNKERGFGLKQQEVDNKGKELDLERYKAVGGDLPGAPGSAAKDAAASSQSVASNGLSQVDPSTLVKHLPQALQQKAYEEIKDNQNISKIAGPSLEAFDRAAKDARPVSAVMSGELPSGSALVPSHIPFVGDTNALTAGQKNFLGLVGTTVKEAEGTSRQAAFDSIKKNFMPQTGDSDATIASKRAAYIQYLQSHASAPVAKGNGIDLSKYASTAIDPKFMAPTDENKNTYIAAEGSTKDWGGKNWKVENGHWVAQPKTVAKGDQ